MKIKEGIVIKILAILVLMLCVGGTIFFLGLIIYFINNIYLYDDGFLRILVFSLMLIVWLLFFGRTVSDMCDLTNIITLDEMGVSNKNHFYEEYLRWEDIKEYDVTKESRIYLSGRRLLSRERMWPDEMLYKIYWNPIRIWYPAEIRKKRNQEKKDIIIMIPYKKERWEYISRMMSNREKLLRERLEEVEGKL